MDIIRIKTSAKMRQIEAISELETLQEIID